LDWNCTSDHWFLPVLSGVSIVGNEYGQEKIVG